MRKLRTLAALIVAALAATFALTATPAQAASVGYTPLLAWPTKQKYGDRWTIYLDRNETAAIAAGGVRSATGILKHTGLPGWAVATAGFAIPGAAHHAVSQSGKCATLQVDILWGWLVSPSAWVRNC